MVVVLGLLILPNLLFLALHGVIDTENRENRAYQAFPELSIANYENIASELEAYYTDRLPFKNQLKHCSSQLDRIWSLGKSNYETYYAMDTVTEGQDGWLFYTVTQADENSVTEMYGRNLYAEEELEALANQATEAQSFFAERGSQLVLLYPPNKEFVYREKLPVEIAEKMTDDSRCQQLAEYLQTHTNVPVSFPLETLREANETYGFTYYKYDTHWNYLGSYLGTQEVLGLLGMEQTPLTEGQIHTTPAGYPRDLLGLLGTDETEPDLFYTIDYKTDVQYVTVECYNNDHARFQSCSSNPQKILVYGDSFSWTMWEFFLRDFSEVILVTKESDAAEVIAKEHPDVILVETVQRRYAAQESQLAQLVEAVSRLEK